MDAEGKINELGRQYIGETSPNTSPNYTSGAGENERPGKSATFVLICPLAAALLLI